jgi:hypothetical protein
MSDIKDSTPDAGKKNQWAAAFILTNGKDGAELGVKTTQVRNAS